MPGTESTHRARKRDGHVPEHHRDSNTTRTLSCSECRRLKLRCDRQWPCQSCVKRGCASICPNGSLTPGGGGNRFILHGSEQLHRKIKEMSERIGQLEDSLSCMWTSASGNSGVEHPLLRRELLKIKLPPDTQNADGSTTNSVAGVGADSTTTSTSDSAQAANTGMGITGGNSTGAIVSAATKETTIKKEATGVKLDYDADCITEELGMLTLDSHGKGSFMGRTARIEFILHADEDDSNSSSSTPGAAGAGLPPHISKLHDSTIAQSPDAHSPAPFGSAIAALPTSIRQLSEGFLFAQPPRCDEDFDSLKRYLPPRTRASALIEVYFEHAGWFYCPITRDQVVNGLFPAFYPSYSTSTSMSQMHHQTYSGHPSPSSSSESAESGYEYGLHDLAVLLMIFAVGALVDLTLPAFNDESEAYHIIARAAICLEPPWDGTTLALIQAFNLMIYFNIQWNQKSVDIEGTWAMMGLAAKFGVSLGLHRDSARWKLSNEDVEKRRMIFWELFTMDSWQSLGYGRPPSINMRHVDCEMPYDPEERRNEDGKVLQRSFQNYKYLFVRECIQPVIEHTFSVKPFTYETIGMLDKKVRSFDFGDLTSELARKSSVASLMQRHILLCMREFTLLYIHRSFFTRVLNTHPNSPLDSPYASSVLATFRCAVTLLQIVRTCYQKHPALISRFWLPYTYLLTSAVVFGSIVFRGPKSSLAPAAYHQLCQTVEMFESSKVHSPRIAKVLPVVHRLRHKAHKALVENGPTAASSLPEPLKPNIRDGPCAQQDELEAYGGKARLVRLDASGHGNHHVHSNTTPASMSTPSTDGGAAGSPPSATDSSRQATPPQSQGRGVTPFIADSSAVQSAFGGPITTMRPSSYSWLTSSAVIPPPVDNLFVASPTSISTPTNITAAAGGGGGGARGMGNPVNSTFPLFDFPDNNFENSPFLQFMQEPINPSSMPMATLPYDTASKPKAASTSSSQSNSMDDLAWLDGFGVGAPMDQFPLISHQSAPTIFNGGVQDGGIAGGMMSNGGMSHVDNPWGGTGSGSASREDWDALFAQLASSPTSASSDTNSNLIGSANANGSMMTMLTNGAASAAANQWSGFGMMAVDDSNGGEDGDEAMRVEPALDDATWQQYMQKLFMNGTGTGTTSSML